MLFGEILKNLLGKKRNVGPAFPKRRNVNYRVGNSVEELIPQFFSAE